MVSKLRMAKSGNGDTALIFIHGWSLEAVQRKVDESG
jgi:hypothetical protein